MEREFVVVSNAHTAGYRFFITPADGGITWHVPVEETPAPQGYYWTEQWQEGEREADQDLSHGHTRDFDTVDSLLAWLHSDEE